jgi:2-polyprenyl-3-methyl-5-hydroxy-6-metoxy-1,4-benzoquinol methylase
VRLPPRETLIAEHARGRSFLDVGCMWSVDGALCFAAEDAGAAAVTGIDVMGESDRFRAERERRRSNVRFVQGDLHDAATIEAAGPHDVVWCSGVIYHAPHPVLTLQRLRALTRETLLLATETIPEVRRRPRAAIFAPAPGSHPAHTEPFDPARGYTNWWWGLTPSATLAMVAAAGFEVVDEFRTRHHLTVVGRPR